MPNTKMVIRDTSANLTAGDAIIPNGVFTQATDAKGTVKLGDGDTRYSALSAVGLSADGVETLTNKTLTSPIITTMLIDDTDAGLTLTSADQTHATPVLTIPDFVDATATVALQDMTEVAPLGTTYSPVFCIGDIAGAREHSAEASFIPFQINLSQTADGGDNTLGAGYVKTATGADLTGQLATWMVRTSISHNVFDSYGVQTHLDLCGFNLTHRDSN